ncbi:MAG: FHA domain-containing protein [Planctomycetota bacterium]|nr:FHA domain-containing protein [Planctomycetota bacterium]
MLRLTVKDSRRQRQMVTGRTEILIGRRDDADVQIVENAASRSHCLLRVENGRVSMVDLGSVNGTTVNGQKFREGDLNVGDIIQIGDTKIRIDALDVPLDELHLANPGDTAESALESPVQRIAGATRSEDGSEKLVHKGPKADFGHELRQMLGKTPWYMISLIVHVVLLLIADLIIFSVDKTSVHVEIMAQDNLMLDGAEELPIEVDPGSDAFAPEFMEEPALPQEAEPASSAPAEEEDFSKFENHDETIGAGSSAMATKLRQPIYVAKGGTGKGDPIGDDVEGANRDAARRVGRKIGPGGRAALRRIGKDRIVVVQGNFDKIEKILDRHTIPYTLVPTSYDLVSKHLRHNQILFINCMRRPLRSTAQKLTKKIKSFVGRGGWLMTSDWALDPFVTNSFKNMVRVIQRKRGKRQKDLVIQVYPTMADHRLIREVFGGRVQTLWWIEESSVLFEVTNPRVHVLIETDEMEKDFGSRQIAFDFTHKKGRVAHVLGHFYQEKGNHQGLVAMHQMIINFILMHQQRES